MYNKLLKRHDRAVEWFDNPDISEEEKDNHQEKFNEMLMEMERILVKLRESGYNISQNNILNGFEVKD